MDIRPLGILDSGLGGLAIYQAISAELPHENTLYLADHAYFPYGAKTPAAINRRLNKIMNFFIARSCKALVIACNTITTNSITVLRQSYSLPIIGTEPAVKQGGVVLVTPATAKSRGYRKLTRQYPVTTIACSGLAEAVEAGTDITSFLPPIPSGTKTIALGCTHYILVKDQIQKIVGNKITLIDPSSAIARQTRKILTKKNLLNNSRAAKHYFFTTGNPSTIKNSIIFSSCAL